MAIQKTEAFILKTQPLRTSSLIVTSFSRSFGKLKGVVKGVRKEGLPHPSAFEPFTLDEIIFYEKTRSDLHLISEVSILESFEGLRSELQALATAYYLCELVDQLTEWHDPHESIFELLHFAFQWLPFVDSPFLSRVFEMRLLSAVGLLPNLAGCLGCGEKNPHRVYFSIRQGGMFCSNCRKRAPESAALSAETLEVLRVLTGERMAEGEWEGLRVKMRELSKDKSLIGEVGNLVDRFIVERLGKRVVSRRFLNQVRSLKDHKRVGSKQGLSPQNSESLRQE